MGFEFFWFYDLLLVAVIIASLFGGIKKGAVGVIISALATIIGFIVAFIGCNVISEAIYKNTIEKPLTEYIDETIEDTVSFDIVDGLAEIDMTKTIVKEKYISENDLSFNDKGIAVLDLSFANVSETGMKEANLEIFGIGEDYNFSEVKIGNVEISKSELKKYGFNTIVLAHTLTHSVTSGELFITFKDVGAKIAEYIPLVFGSYEEKISEGKTDTLYELVLSVIYVQNGKFGSIIMDNIVNPIVLIPLKVVIFILLFIIIVSVLNLIAKASRIINKIPVVASLNELLGAVLSLAEALIVLIVICTAIKLVISVGGDSLVFLNENTIDKTFLFKTLYYFDPLEILSVSLIG